MAIATYIAAAHNDCAAHNVVIGYSDRFPAGAGEDTRMAQEGAEEVGTHTWSDNLPEKNEASFSHSSS